MTRTSKAGGVWFPIVLFLLATVLTPNRVWAGDGLSAETGGHARSIQVASSYSDGPGPVEMILDGLVVRPLSLVMTVVGTVAFVVTAPFSALGGNIGEAADQLVVSPAAYTFTRCLGCWEREHQERAGG